MREQSISEGDCFFCCRLGDGTISEILNEISSEWINVSICSSCSRQSLSLFCHIIRGKTVGSDKFPPSSSSCCLRLA